MCIHWDGYTFECGHSSRSTFRPCNEALATSTEPPTASNCKCPKQERVRAKVPYQVCNDCTLDGSKDEEHGEYGQDHDFSMPHPNLLTDEYYMRIGDVLSAQQAYLLNKGPLKGEYDPYEYIEDD